MRNQRVNLCQLVCDQGECTARSEIFTSVDTLFTTHFHARERSPSHLVVPQRKLGEESDLRVVILNRLSRLELLSNKESINNSEEPEDCTQAENNVEHTGVYYSTDSLLLLSHSPVSKESKGEPLHDCDNDRVNFGVLDSLCHVDLCV